jgi:hypothetical protein
MLLTCFLNIRLCPSQSSGSVWHSVSFTPRHWHTGSLDVGGFTGRHTTMQCCHLLQYNEVVSYIISGAFQQEVKQLVKRCFDFLSNCYFCLVMCADRAETYYKKRRYRILFEISIFWHPTHYFLYLVSRPLFVIYFMSWYFIIAHCMFHCLFCQGKCLIMKGFSSVMPVAGL